MSRQIRDTFTRANSATLIVTETGEPWVPASGLPPLSVRSQRAANPVVGVSAGGAMVDLGAVDVDVTVTLSRNMLAPGSARPLLFIDASPDLSAYVGLLADTSVGGDAEVVVSTAISSRSVPLPGYTLPALVAREVRLNRVGADVEVWVDAVLLDTVVLTALEMTQLIGTFAMVGSVT